MARVARNDSFAEMTRDRRLTLIAGSAMLALAFGVKWWYRTATVADLGFLLSPVSALVETATGSQSIYSHELGYTFPALSMRIDRSCSGINFLIIAIASFTLLIIRRPDGGCARPLLVLLSLPLAYSIAILANASRIICLATAQPAGWLAAPRMHEAFGAFVFLSYLVGAVLLLHRTLPRTSS